MRNSDITTYENQQSSAEADHGPPSADRRPVSFSDPDNRAEGMRGTIESWLDELTDRVTEARASEAFQAWLDVQSRFHDYSYRNTLLIKFQRPDATRVAGYRTWQEEFDRHVKDGEEAIWIWAPIVAKRCPDCGNSRSYHEDSDCDYDDEPPEEWSEGVVGFKPVPVFDVSQTEGEPLPALETAAQGDGKALLERLLNEPASDPAAVRLVPTEDWRHGPADGVCRWPDGPTSAPVIEVRDRPNEAAVAGTLIHELAHARLHADVEQPAERSKREVEAEAVAYVVGRYFRLDTSNSAFYLAAWQDEERNTITDRLARISGTAEQLIEEIEG